MTSNLLDTLYNKIFTPPKLEPVKVYEIWYEDESGCWVLAVTTGNKKQAIKVCLETINEIRKRYADYYLDEARKDFDCSLSEKRDLAKLYKNKLTSREVSKIEELLEVGGKYFFESSFGFWIKEIITNQIKYPTYPSWENAERRYLMRN